MYDAVIMAIAGMIMMGIILLFRSVRDALKREKPPKPKKERVRRGPYPGLVGRRAYEADTPKEAEGDDIVARVFWGAMAVIAVVLFILS